MENQFSNILVCIDSSKKSHKALIKAMVIAEKFDSDLIILMVIEEGLVDFWSETEFNEDAKRS